MPQPELSVWLWAAAWVVVAVLAADDVAELLSFCVAALEPPVTSPPAIETGTLALTPF